MWKLWLKMSYFTSYRISAPSRGFLAISYFLFIRNVTKNTKTKFQSNRTKNGFFRAFYSFRRHLEYQRHLEFFSWATLRDFFSVVHSTIKNLNIAFSTKIANNAISDQTITYNGNLFASSSSIQRGSDY